MYIPWTKNRSVQTLCTGDLVKFEVPEILRFIRLGRLSDSLEFWFNTQVEGQVTKVADNPQRVVEITVICVKSDNCCIQKTFFVTSGQIAVVDESHERKLF